MRPERLAQHSGSSGSELTSIPDSVDTMPWEDRVVHPGELVPTMLEKRELDYLAWLASQLGSAGRIVELGCLLGGSTAAIASGRNRNGGTGASPPSLVYDSFVAPDAEVFEQSPDLALFGLEPNRSFRDLFVRLHRSRLDTFEIREGMIPESLCGEEAKRLYPEQAPIGLLFIDLAKTWGVHLSVMHGFGCHVVPGGVVVQQDFGDFRTPWLALHMWRLRDQFEVLDRVRETSSVSFRRVGDGPLDLRSLDPSPESCASDAWDGIVDHWAGLLARSAGEGAMGPEDAGGWLAGHRAAHMLHAHRFQDAVESARAHEEWRRTEHREGVFCSPAWPAWLRDLPGHLRNRGAGSSVVHDSEVLHAECAAHGDTADSGTDRVGDAHGDTRARIWLEVKNTLQRQGCATVALYGAGRHTRWLLGSGWPGPGLRVACILDDNPGVDEICGIPVLAARSVEAEKIREVLRGATLLPSSDAYEREILERAAPIAARLGALLQPVYTSQHAVEGEIGLASFSSG